jgi:hypothetical protein
MTTRPSIYTYSEDHRIQLGFAECSTPKPPSLDNLIQQLQVIRDEVNQYVDSNSEVSVHYEWREANSWGNYNPEDQANLRISISVSRPRTDKEMEDEIEFERIRLKRDIDEAKARANQAKQEAKELDRKLKDLEKAKK